MFIMCKVVEFYVFRELLQSMKDEVYIFGRQNIFKQKGVWLRQYYSIVAFSYLFFILFEGVFNYKIYGCNKKEYF